jgi:succinate-semialdehyde dehydrogenase/glutarate-semialdehyde dehydrogenase
VLIGSEISPLQIQNQFDRIYFMAIQSVNPATGKITKTFKPENAVEVDKKIQQADKAFSKWKKKTVKERVELIAKLADHMVKNKEEYAKVVTEEMGRPYKDSVSEMEKSAKICKYYIENGEKFLAPEEVKTEATKSYVQYDPIGVILGVMPWNYPFAQAFRPAIPALISGNTFILKHASNVPQSSLLIEEAFKKSGFPEGVFTSVLIEGASTEQLIADDQIAAVTLTGSEAAGKQIAALAGKHLKKTVLELGGSDAFIVLDDADIEEAAKIAVKARAVNGGQSCNSPKRFIVHEKIADKFTKIFLEEAKKLKVGDPFNPDTNIGPVAREDLLEHLHWQVHESLRHGARLLLGGEKIEGEGFYYKFTVVDQAKKGMPVFDEEVFGPVAVISEVKSEDEAIEVANDSHLGLSASVWTKDIKKSEKFIHNLHVGLVFINQPVRSDPRLPYGGVKKSGYGRELGIHGIREFVNIKSVVIK